MRQLDSSIIAGLLIRETVFTIPPMGYDIVSPDQRWKYFFVSRIEKIVNWCLKTIIWKLLGVGLILPHKEDILQGRLA